MHPLALVIITASGFSALAWGLSLITREFSWVDRLWSVVPVIYVTLFAAALHFHDARLNSMALLVFCWGARLTFNFARKGGYSGVEDYRWAVLRARMSSAQFQWFNLLFIVLYQNALLVLITLPTLTATQHRGPFGAADAVLAVAFVGSLVGETVADEQQWRFQRRKAAARAAGETPMGDFCTSGLFRFSRHPNYFFELAQWWLVFGFAASAAGSVTQWTVLGPVLLTALFAGSTRFTESITLSKYPSYANYQAATSPVIPWFSRALR